jgi:phage terminase large subunit
VTGPEVKAEFPKKLQPIFQPSRYKVLHSGRDAAKSWSVARALLIEGAQAPIRVLCARETQKSIRDSVHKLLSDQVEQLGLSSVYTVLQSTITNGLGTEFIFVGLSDQTAESIKSYEGVDRCWVEEAQYVSARSWNILTKTIRKEGSQIWITFNPELDTDPTWVRFVENPYPDSIVIGLTYRDNPWHSKVMEDERVRDEKILSKIDYDNLWEGKTRPAVAGAVYADEVAMMYQEKRIGDFPYDPFLPVFAIFDLGWNDQTSIIVAQRHLSRLAIIHYIEDSHKGPDFYSAELRKTDYPIVQLFLPHDGAHHGPGTGVSAKDMYEGLKWRVEVLPNTPKEEQIRNARLMFRGTYIDRRCERLIECLKRYRRTVPNQTGEPGAPLHDEFCLHPHELVWTRHGMYPIMDLPKTGEVMTSCGFKPYVNPRITRRNARLVEVRFKDGSTVKCTPEHLFKTAGGWKSAEQLQKGSPILSCSIHSRSILMGIFTACGRLRVITPKAPLGYIATFGSLLSGRFLSAVISITGMGTQRATVLRTSNAFPLLSTYQIHGQSGQNISPAQQLCAKQPNGTDLKRAAHGIVGTPENRRVGRNGKGRLSRVLTVARNLWGSTAKVKQLKYSAAIRVKPALIESVTAVNERVDTWCLDVPSIHEFCLANGAIVHNSHGADCYSYTALAAPQMENFNGTMQGMKLPPLKYQWQFK